MLNNIGVPLTSGNIGYNSNLNVTGAVTCGSLTVTGNETDQSNLTVNGSITCGSLSTNNPVTLPTTYITPTSAQLGYTVSSFLATGNSSVGYQNQLSLTLPYPGVYILQGNMAVNQLNGFINELSISPTTGTINNNSHFYGYNNQGYTAAFGINVSLIYVNTTSNKTMYLVSGNNNGGFSACYNVYFIATRIA